jgi:sulfate transport system permease protein
MIRKKFNALPGFGLTMGFSLFYLSAIVLFPIAGLLLKTCGEGWTGFFHNAFSERAVAAYKLTIGGSLIAAVINAFFGAVLAWVLVRYQFPGKRLVDALVDIPFALPTAVAGLTLANLFSANGWIGEFLAKAGIQAVYNRTGVIIALTFVSLPFVVRTLQPVVENLEREVEEAAAMLGAGRLKTFISVVAPALLPALITGFALSFARALGEYGSVIFISSNLQYKTEIAPLVITSLLDEYQYGPAMSIAVVLLLFSFVLLAVINLLEKWVRRFEEQ